MTDISSTSTVDHSSNNTEPNTSGCELLLPTSNTPSEESKHRTASPLQVIRRAFEYSSKYFQIVYLDERCGYGAIARADIPKHTLILEEPPLLPCDALQVALEEHEACALRSHEDDTRYLRCYFEQQYAKVDDLSDEEKQLEVQTLIDLFWSMHDQYEITNGEKRIWGINYSNAFFNSEQTAASNGTNKKSANESKPNIFRPTIHFIAAKLNHSCRPNVGYDFNRNWQRIFTTRDIQKGQELCDCYSDVVYHEPANVRKLFLKAKYSFDCRCDACTYPASEQDESDERRMNLKEIAKQLSTRIGASFMYNEHFDREIQAVTGESDGSDEEDYSWRTANEGVCNSKKMRPKSDDLYNLLDYVELLQKEGIDHDMIECMELAFDLAVFLNDEVVLNQQLYQMGDNVLKLYEIAKGDGHKLTKQFRKKVLKSKMK